MRNGARFLNILSLSDASTHRLLRKSKHQATQSSRPREEQLKYWNVVQNFKCLSCALRTNCSSPISCILSPFTIYNLPSKNPHLFCQFLTCAWLLSFTYSSVSAACKFVIYLHNLFSGNCCDCIKFFDGCCFSVGVYRVTQLN